MIFEFRLVDNIWQQMAALGKESTHGQCRMYASRAIVTSFSVKLKFCYSDIFRFSPQPLANDGIPSVEVLSKTTF